MGQVLTTALDPWPNTDISWPELLSTTGAAPMLDILFHSIVLLTSFAIIVTYFSVWGANWSAPSMPKITTTQRISFTDASFNIDDLMINYQVATAAYGGIYTEQNHSLSYYNGTVSPDAVDDQIAAGARALIFDVWPNPADPSQPCVAAMEQSTGWWMTSGGLAASGSGISNGGSSNWKRLTRNVESLPTMLQPLFTAAAQYSSDPFFAIFNLHGAMTTAYLNTVGSMIIKALTGYRMSTEYDKNGGASLLCTAKVSAFQGKVFTIANIVVDSGFQSLPGFTTQGTVNTEAMNASTFAESINLLAGYPHPNVVSIPGASAIQTTMVPGCSSSTQVPLSQTTFTIIQPTTGSLDTTNDSQYMGTTSFINCLGLGAQFVGVNMFDAGNSADNDTRRKVQGNTTTLGDFFRPKVFGSTSFHKLGTPYY